MANKNIDMSKLRQILKLYCWKKGTRKISELTGVSRTTVMKYLERYRVIQIPWDELSKFSDKDLEAIFNE